ncbi:PepSY-associated TM helix domain-containing protein [Pulveribacter sp.]|uniref:PepSY-associated TM helix domain-containing protein n=1 Tax=Pulveribacter sp. TaxID=2678893 RepID=UPI0028ACB0F7|nr:PepSY-associated TM helix domain-containing protein [Pulveribacter sp.]
MRAFWTVVHRWAGLTVALFLIVAGLTGAVISWDHEIDEWLNADIMHTPGRGPLQDPLVLAAAVEADDPRAEVSYMTLGLEEGHAASFLVRPRTDPATGAKYALGYNTVYVDPVTARITGNRDSRSIALSKRNLMPWLRHLHESLHMPAFWGSDRWGFRLMGVVALVWLLDSFVALYLTFPPRQAVRSVRTWASRWRPSWLLRWRAGGYKLNFDLHRAGGLWVWGVIIVVSFTSFSLNLYREVFYPGMSTISTTTPGPYETLKPAPLGTFIEPRIGFADAIAIARHEGERLGFAHPPGGIWYGGDFPFYNVSFFDPGNEMGALGMGLSNIYVSSDTGEVLGTHRPWHGTAADVFVQLQLPLHSGRILALPGRILMSLMGLVVVMLSVTGIVIWERKRRARRLERPAARGLAGVQARR